MQYISSNGQRIGWDTNEEPSETYHENCGRELRLLSLSFDFPEDNSPGRSYVCIACKQRLNPTLAPQPDPFNQHFI